MKTTLNVLLLLCLGLPLQASGVVYKVYCQDADSPNSRYIGTYDTERDAQAAVNATEDHDTVCHVLPVQGEPSGLPVTVPSGAR